MRHYNPHDNLLKPLPINGLQHHGNAQLKFEIVSDAR